MVVRVTNARKDVGTEMDARLSFSRPCSLHTYEYDTNTRACATPLATPLAFAYVGTSYSTLEHLKVTAEQLETFFDK